MEKFRLRVRNEPKRGNLWELHLVPYAPQRVARQVTPRLLGSASTPESIQWLSEVAAPFFQRLDPPVKVESFGPKSEPVHLDQSDGMRLALAFSSARYLATPRHRLLFRLGLAELPDEVLLYWFTLCFYGRRTGAGRAALRTLLTYEEPEDSGRESVARPKSAGSRRPGVGTGPLFATSTAGGETGQPEGGSRS